jgi:hypothetical protein
VSLLPEVEAIIQTSVRESIDNVTRRTGDPANFSISTNMIILGRLTFALTEQRKGHKPDREAIEWLMDLVDGKRRITDRDLQDYAKFMAVITEAYLQRHSITLQNIT